MCARGNECVDYMCVHTHNHVERKKGLPGVQNRLGILKILLSTWVSLNCLTHSSSFRPSPSSHAGIVFPGVKGCFLAQHPPWCPHLLSCGRPPPEELPCGRLLLLPSLHKAKWRQQIKDDNHNNKECGDLLRLFYILKFPYSYPKVPLLGCYTQTLCHG